MNDSLMAARISWRFAAVTTVRCLEIGFGPQFSMPLDGSLLIPRQVLATLNDILSLSLVSNVEMN